MNTRPIKTVLLMLFLLMCSLPAAPTKAGEGSRPDPDQSKESIKTGFSTLAVLEAEGALVAYNSRGSKVINQKLSALPKTHPLHAVFAETGDRTAVLMLEARLESPDAAPSYVVYSANECCPEFHFYTTTTPVRRLGGLAGSAISVPGNGSVYVASRQNATYTRRGKYRISAQGFTEIRQPFHSVGFKTKTLKPIVLFAAQEGTEEVARLPEGADIEVVLFDPAKPLDSANYLVRTPFGLLGWVKIPSVGPHSDPARLNVEGMNHWGE